MNTQEWFEDHDNLCLVADWMVIQGYKAADLAYFIEKPYKYEKEYKAALEAQGD